MAYTFKKLGEVEALTEVPEGANVLAEVNGEVKRVPGSGLGGGIKTAIIKDSNYDNSIAGVSTFLGDAPAVTYSCMNMTFEEAHQTMIDGNPLGSVFMVAGEGARNLIGMTTLADLLFGLPCIVLSALAGNITLFWTADGISETEPSQPK